MTRADLASVLLFADARDRADLLDASRTTDSLVALLAEIAYAAARSGESVLVTSVRSSHTTPDSGPHSHASGNAADLWLLYAPTPNAAVDASDPAFAAWLRAIAASSNVAQIGLGGSADTNANAAASGAYYLTDNTQDHVHVGAVGGSSNPMDELSSLAENAQTSVREFLADPLGIGKKIEAEKTALVTQYGPMLAGLAVGLTFFAVGALMISYSWGESLAENVGRLADKLPDVIAKGAELT